MRIAFTQDLAQALGAYELLKAEGMRVMPIDESAHIYIAGATQGYWIEVHPEDAERAVAILRDSAYATLLDR